MFKSLMRIFPMEPFRSFRDIMPGQENSFAEEPSPLRYEVVFLAPFTILSESACPSQLKTLVTTQRFYYQY